MAARLIAGIAASLLCVQIVRSATVEAFAEMSPATAERAWPSHPDVLISSGMVEIAQAASKGGQATSEAKQKIMRASTIAPLASEPFLVRGVEAQVSGDRSVAEAAFRGAEARDGRSLPARYFLAEHYFRRGDAANGLREVAVLGRLVPEGMSRLAPYVASYARDRANWPELRKLFQEQPALAGPTLTELSRDAANADTVLYLGDPRLGAKPGGWMPILIGTLIEARAYDRAHKAWALASGLEPNKALLFDPAFSRPEPLPPFNWSLASSTVGLAERQKGGGLHVIYYGQEDGALAIQLLLLTPGTYSFSARATGPGLTGDALQWRLTCQATNALIASASLRQAAGGWRFHVPSDCPAERLELFGVSSEVSQQTEAKIASVSLARVAS